MKLICAILASSVVFSAALAKPFGGCRGDQIVAARQFAKEYKAARLPKHSEIENFASCFTAHGSLFVEAGAEDDSFRILDEAGRIKNQRLVRLATMVFSRKSSDEANPGAWVARSDLIRQARIYNCQDGSSGEDDHGKHSEARAEKLFAPSSFGPLEQSPCAKDLLRVAGKFQKEYCGGVEPNASLFRTPKYGVEAVVSCLRKDGYIRRNEKVVAPYAIQTFYCNAKVGRFVEQGGLGSEIEICTTPTIR